MDSVRRAELQHLSTHGGQGSVASFRCSSRRHRTKSKSRWKAREEGPRAQPSPQRETPLTSEC